MDIDKPIRFDAETLAALCHRLADHADSVDSIAGYQLELDLRSAARALALFASLKFRVGEIAEMALSQDGGVIHRDLRQALDDAQG